MRVPHCWIYVKVGKGNVMDGVLKRRIDPLVPGESSSPLGFLYR